MPDTTPRRRQRGADLTPEQRAAIEEVRARHRTPEARAEAARVREAVRQEFPPLVADEDLLELLASLRHERERQGLSLADVSERTGMDRSMISRLELGKIPNPTLATIKAYAGALGRSLDLSERPLIAVDRHGHPYIHLDSREAPELVAFLLARGVPCTVDGRAETGSGSTPALSVIQLDPKADLYLVRRLLRAWEVRELLSFGP